MTRTLKFLTQALKNWQKWLLLAVAFAFALYRLINRDLVAFVADEPIFLDAARAQITSGHWVSVSPLVGNQGLHYGPTVLWFYGLLHTVFGPDPSWHILAMIVLVTSANLAAAVAIGKLFLPRSQLAAALAALVASSPYHFFWSRIAWDQSVEILTGWSIAILCVRGRLHWVRAAAVGVLMGFAISSHLMVTPVAILLGLYMLISSSLLRSLVNAVTYGGCILAVNIPYFRYLLDAPRVALPPGGPLLFDDFLQRLQEPLRVATTKGIEYFFDGDWPKFSETGSWVAQLQSLSNGLVFGLLILVVGLLWAVFRGIVPGPRRMALLALVTWFGYAAFLAQRHLDIHPHYQFPTWWVVLVGVAAILARVALRNRSLYRWGLAFVWGLSLAQMCFLVHWMGYIRENSGTQGIHYGATLAEQKRAVAEACSRPGQNIVIHSHVTIFSQSLSYLASIAGACTGKTLLFGENDQGTSVSLNYADPRKARLVVK